ncbi:MAG: B12-binding domain-containing radical SAM protein [Candidatus Hydrogenedentes bacterium]|nr:B12-binding domain-containing radical SAM protein [Candidatus Hydrogenedentota bacterium]
MNVLFVLPPFNMSASYGTTTKMKRGFLPSLGIGHLAAMVEADGHKATLLDAQIMDLDPIQTVERIIAHGPDVVAISLMNVFAHAGYAVASELRARDPNVFIVVGGPHVTSDCRRVFSDCPAVNAAVPGEGEMPFRQIVAALSAKEDWRSVKGIAYLDASGRPFVNGTAEIVDDLDVLPHPARHIFAPYSYRPLPNQVRREPATTAISSRGCSWGKCTFCFQGGEFSPRYRRHSPEHMIAQIVPLVREHGMREIIFWDDTFAVNPRWIDDFCAGLKREKLDLTWSCYGHMRSVKPDMLKKMADAGCFNIYYGFESGVQELLDLIKKGTTRQQIRDTVRWTRDAGIEVRGSFILGFPTETPEQSLETIRFACELNADWMMFFPFHIQPGTPIEALAHQDGRVIETQTTVYFPEFVSSGYTDKEQVHAMVKKAYFDYYMRPRYWTLVMRNLVKRPYLFKYYYDAVKYWLDLTRGGLTLKDVEEKAPATSASGC